MQAFERKFSFLHSYNGCSDDATLLEGSTEASPYENKSSVALVMFDQVRVRI